MRAIGAIFRPTLSGPTAPRTSSTWADLAGLSFDGFVPDKSVVDPKFVERPLLVGDPGNPKALIDLRRMMGSGAPAAPKP